MRDPIEDDYSEETEEIAETAETVNNEERDMAVLAAISLKLKQLLAAAIEHDISVYSLRAQIYQALDKLPSPYRSLLPKSQVSPSTIHETVPWVGDVCRYLDGAIELSNLTKDAAEETKDE